MNYHKGQRSSVGIDVKCECGKLLGIEKPTGIEVKCRGCKRVVLIEPKGGRDVICGQTNNSVFVANNSPTDNRCICQDR